jgi:hypothetical protein
VILLALERHCQFFGSFVQIKCEMLFMAEAMSSGLFKSIVVLSQI